MVDRQAILQRTTSNWLHQSSIASKTANQNRHLLRREKVNQQAFMKIEISLHASKLKNVAGAFKGECLPGGVVVQQPASWLDSRTGFRLCIVPPVSSFAVVSLPPLLALPPIASRRCCSLDLPTALLFEGTSDPFAVVTRIATVHGSSPHVLGKTEVVKNCLSPQWYVHSFVQHCTPPGQTRVVKSEKT